MRRPCLSAHPRVLAFLRRAVARAAPDLEASRGEAEALRAEVARLESRLDEVLTQIDALVERVAAVRL